MKKLAFSCLVAGLLAASCVSLKDLGPILNPPSPKPSPTPIGPPVTVPTQAPTPTPEPKPVPTPIGPPVTVPTPPPTSPPTPAPKPPTPPPPPCLTSCPSSAFTCIEKIRAEAAHGHGIPLCAPDGTGPKRLMVPSGPFIEGTHVALIEFSCPAGERVKYLYNDPGGNAAARRYVDMQCNVARPGGAGGGPFWPEEQVCDPKPCKEPTPSPTPGPVVSPPAGGTCRMPEQCPALKVWRGGLHNCADEKGRPSKKADGSPLPVPGGWCIVDTTPGFVGGPRGLPCNEEHNAVCSCTGTDQPKEAQTWRRCEDPRGPAFEVSGSGAARWKVDDNPFQLKVNHTGGGQVKVRICPRNPLLDEYGQRVGVQGDACTEREWAF